MFVIRTDNMRRQLPQKFIIEYHIAGKICWYPHNICESGQNNHATY